MEARQIAALVERADAARRAHDWPTAIELLKRALTLDPEHSIAHASLGLALLGARRLHGAIIEAELAVGFDPNSPYCHYAAAAVRFAERKLDEAWRHVLVAMQDDEDSLDARVLGAAIKRSQNEVVAARALLDEALAIDPEHAHALTEVARLDYEAGKLDDAEQRIEQALATDPGEVDAHVIAGYIALARGQVDDAERHARCVLGQDATSHDALRLYTAIKARRNVLLGLWWRWSVFVGLRSERGLLGFAIGSFVIVRLLIIVLGAAGFEDAEILVTKLWLGFCAYTWFAPEIFNRMLRRELTSVALRDDY